LEGIGGAKWRTAIPTPSSGIDQARDQLASTVDSLAERANPRKIADDLRAGVVRFVKKPAVAMSLAGLGALVLALSSAASGGADGSDQASTRGAEPVGERDAGRVWRPGPRRLQLCTMMGSCAVTSSAKPAPDAPV